MSDPDHNRLRATAQRASVRDVRRLLDSAPGPLDGSPMGGILESLRIGLAGNLQADKDAALWSRSMGADRHHVRAALHALVKRAAEKASFFDALAYELSRAVKECRPEERAKRRGDLRPVFEWAQTGDIYCMARSDKGHRCPERARDAKPYCRRHQQDVDEGKLPEPSPVTLIDADGAEYVREATLQDVEHKRKPGHVWEPERDSWQLGRGRWVPVVELDEMNWEAIEAWEERAQTPAPGYVVVLAWKPERFTQQEIAEYMEQHVTVNQVRATRLRPVLPPLPEPEGSMTVARYREKIGTAHAEAAGVHVTARDVQRAIDRYCDVVRASEAFAELFAMSEHGALRVA